MRSVMSLMAIKTIVKFMKFRSGQVERLWRSLLALYTEILPKASLCEEVQISICLMPRDCANEKNEGKQEKLEKANESPGTVGTLEGLNLETGHTVCKAEEENRNQISSIPWGDGRLENEPQWIDEEVKKHFSSGWTTVLKLFFQVRVESWNDYIVC